MAALNHPTSSASRMLRLRALLALLIIGLFCPLKLLGGDRDLEAVFERRGVKGTMVISSLDGCDTFVHDADRADLRFPAASTFKILNTLIALQEGAVKGRDEVIRWDGTVRDFPDWNRDQTLGSAFSSSCVWYYQELARRVGAEKYRGYIRRCAYGKLGEPFDTATFWLDGTLVISAQEQVAFLRKLCRRTLPFRDSAYETLRGIMAVDDEQGYTLRAKSGWAAGVTPQVGWYVGYVEKGGRVWLFAMNMEVRKREELPLRREIALEALRAKGLID